ncbi:MAG: MOSC domain-containing protein [Thermoplasmata archaeon]|nr:MAG: MOSC domain-containing protein [Thermoplasmata archaeon]
MQGIVISINISHKKGLKKTPVKEAIVNERGIVGDAHAGEWHRQISLLAEESIEKMRELGLKIGYGDFAENITTKNIDLSKLRIGQKIRVGKEVILEITQIGKKCHDECEIKRLIGKCVMPKEGVFARVISGGKIKVGDEIIVLE